MEITDIFCDLFSKYGEDFNWYTLPSSQADGTFVEELKKEVGKDHFLSNKQIRAVAKCESNDDVLYVTKDSSGVDIYYIFHLTYSEQNADGFPKYIEFADIYTVKEFMERSFFMD